MSEKQIESRRAFFKNAGKVLGAAVVALPAAAALLTPSQAQASF